MREFVSRLRAVLTPQALAVLAAMLLLAGSIFARGSYTEEPLERRIEKALSSVRNSGNVQVVIQRQTIAGAGMRAGESQTVITGAVAVASGADDPLVRMEIEEALCALLGLAPSAVCVLAGGE